MLFEAPLSNLRFLSCGSPSGVDSGGGGYTVASVDFSACDMWNGEPGASVVWII